MHELDQIKAPVASYVDDFHSQFASILATKSEWLEQAIQHLNASTGKKVRPILTALMAGLVGSGEPSPKSIDAAVLLELIHTATLIHDDVIDEAKTRRGQPTLGAIFDNRVAVLMGNYYEIIYQKTAVLFRSCAEVAAITMEATPEALEQAVQIGTALGMAFQIRDDIFDYYRSDVGKPTGNDLREGKVTLPLLHVLLELQAEGKAEPYLQLLEDKPITDEAVERLTALAFDAGGIDYAWQKLYSYIEEAKTLLRTFEESPYRSSLLALADYIASRTH